VPSDDASLAMPAFADTRPVTRHVDHITGVEHSVTKQVVELKSGSIDGPVVTSLWVVEVVTFRCQYSQVLNVAPCQLRTAYIRTDISLHVILSRTPHYCCKAILSVLSPPLTRPPKRFNMTKCVLRGEVNFISLYNIIIIIILMTMFMVLSS